MSYCIRREQAIEQSLREIAIEQTDEAIAEVDDDQLGLLETVHQVRKRCKKVRGLLRLVRPHFPEFQREDEFLRVAVDDLAAIRNSQAMIDCLESLLEHFWNQLDSVQAEPIFEVFFNRQRAVLEKGSEEKLCVLRARVEAIGRRAAWWQINLDGFRALEDGLMRTYQHCRNALHSAYAYPKNDVFHQWRKQVKYHRHHVRLLRGICPSMMKVQRRAIDELSEILGEDQDLHTLRETLLNHAEQFGSLIQVQPIVGLINRRRAELQKEARPLGEWIFAEESKNLAERFGRYWDTWRTTEDDQPIQEETLTLVYA